jgi:hypothetical protein
MNVPDNEFYQALGRIEGTLSALKESVDRALAAHDSIEKRVRRLEEWRWKLVGAAVALSVLATYAVKFIADR